MKQRSPSEVKHDQQELKLNFKSVGDYSGTRARLSPPTVERSVGGKKVVVSASHLLKMFLENA